MAEKNNGQLRLVLVLTLIAAVSGGILAVVNYFTEPKIKEAEEKATNAAWLPVARGRRSEEETLPRTARM